MGVEWPANSVFRWGACKLPVIRRVWYGFRNPAESFALKCGSAARGLLLQKNGFRSSRRVRQGIYSCPIQRSRVRPPWSCFQRMK